MRRNVSRQCLFGMILLVFVTGVVVRAQTPTSTPSLEKEFFKNILRDQKAIWLAPFHVRRLDTKWMIPGGLGLGALITTDRISGDEIGESERQVKASRIISSAGSVYGLGTAAGAFYLFGRSRNDNRARETGILSAQAMIDSVIVGEALKGISQRARPLDGVERSEFFDGGSSFPSGHATQAWAVATVVANEYHDRRAVQFAAYGIASSVSVARFTGHKHYLSDVAVGSALGYGIGKYVYHRYHRDESVTEFRWPMITPQVNRATRQYGVALTWSF